MYNAAAKAAFLYQKLNPKGCIHAVQVDSDARTAQPQSLSLPISIHAARVDSDLSDNLYAVANVISIHAAHEGSDAI